MHRFALKHISNNHLAEELVMDLMICIWEKRHQLRPDQSIAPYLYRALRNAIIDRYRRKRSLVIIQEELHDLPIVGAATDGYLQAKELETWYLRQLDGLPASQRTAFQLSRDEGLSYPQIAERMNVSVKAVEKYISKTLVNIRKNLRYHTDLTLWAVILLSGLLGS